MKTIKQPDIYIDMNIFENLRSLLIENALLQQLKDKYVGEGKPVSDAYFELIENVSKNKFYLIQWLTKKVGTFIIKDEDIYKYEEYFEIFEKNKSKFPYTDINQVKTADDVQEFIRKCIEIREGNIRFEEQPKGDNYLTQSEIEKLERGGGSKYLGMFDDYQVFQITKPNEENWKVYRDLLGRCKGREQGAKIEICTIGQFSYFKKYLKEDRGSSYFVLYNLNDPKSPYQLHVETNQFMDKDDDPDIKINKFKFYDWLSEKSPKYSRRKVFKHLKQEGDWLPVEGKSSYDEYGKQGLWYKWSRYDKKIDSKAYFKNDLKDGLEVVYNSNGTMYMKCEWKDGERNGLYIEYNDEKKVEEKGMYRDGDQVGKWFYRGGWPRYGDAKNRIVDYDSKPEITTFYREDGTLESKFVGEVKGKSYVEIYYSDGQIKAKGKRSKQGKSGIWDFYKPNGELLVQGKFNRDSRVGVFKYYLTEVVKIKGVRRRLNLIYNVNFSTRHITVYHGDKQLGPSFGFFDKKGEEFLRKVGYFGNKPDVTRP